MEEDKDYPDYIRLSELLRMAGENRDWDAADRLTPIVSELAEAIGRRQGLPGARPDTPYYRRWDQAWVDLRKAQKNGDESEADRLVEELMDMAGVMDFIKNTAKVVKEVASDRS